MKPLRCGVAGLGRGRLFVDVFDKLPGCRTVAVCDSKDAALADYGHLAAHTDYDAFLAEGLDVVAVITPGPVHADQSVRAMDAGAHVLCETPCVYSLDEARDVVAATHRTGRAFMLAEDYIWMGWTLTFKQHAKAGHFGEIVYAEGDYTHDCRNLMLTNGQWFIPYDKWDENPDAVKTWRATHMPPITYCSHTLGPLLHIMDDRVVSAVGLSTGAHTAPDLCDIDAEAALLKTARGAVIRLTNGFSIACPMTLFYNLVGTAGAARLQNVGGLSAKWYSEAADPPTGGWQDLPTQFAERPDGRDHVEVMVAEFIQSIIDGTPPPLDVYKSMDLVLPGVLAHQSAMQGGTPMEVPDLRSGTTG